MTGDWHMEEGRYVHFRPLFAIAVSVSPISEPHMQLAYAHKPCAPCHRTLCSTQRLKGFNAIVAALATVKRVIAMGRRFGAQLSVTTGRESG